MGSVGGLQHWLEEWRSGRGRGASSRGRETWMGSPEAETEDGEQAGKLQSWRDRDWGRGRTRARPRRPRRGVGQCYPATWPRRPMTGVARPAVSSLRRGRVAKNAVNGCQPGSWKPAWAGEAGCLDRLGPRPVRFPRVASTPSDLLSHFTTAAVLDSICESRPFVRPSDVEPTGGIGSVATTTSR